MRYLKGSFITIPNKEVLKGLPPYIQTVYMWICSFADETGLCFPSRIRLAECAGCSESSVKRAFEVLEEKGILKRTERKKEDGYNLTNTYQIIIVDKGEGFYVNPMGFSNSQERGSERTTELYPVLTKSTITADAENLRIEETDKEGNVREKKPKKDSYEPALQWAENRRGFKFVNRIKQYAHLKKAALVGVGVSQLKDRWVEMEGKSLPDGFDWGTVLSSFDRKK